MKGFTEIDQTDDTEDNDKDTIILFPDRKESIKKFDIKIDSTMVALEEQMIDINNV